MEQTDDNVNVETLIPPDQNNVSNTLSQHGNIDALFIGFHPGIVERVAKNGESVEAVLFDVEKLPQTFPSKVYLHTVGNPKTVATAKKVLADLGCDYIEVAFKPEHIQDPFIFSEVLEKTAKFKTPAPIDSATKKKLVELGKASVKGKVTTKPPAPSFLLLNLIRKAITGFLEGAGGTSKSMWLTQLQVCLATRRLFLGKFSVAPEGVGSSFVIYGEETDDELQSRLYYICQQLQLTPKEIALVEARVFMCSMADADHYAVLCKEGHGEAQPTQMIDELLNTLEDLDDLVFVAFDPLAKFFGANLMDSKDGYRYTHELKRICKAKGATVLTLNHINKSGLRDGGSLAAAGYGAVGFRDSSRIMINITVMTETQAKKRGVDPDDHEFYLQMTITKNNYMPPTKGESWLRRGDHGVLSYVELASVQEAMPKDSLDWMFVLDYIKVGATNGQQYGKTDILNAGINGESGYPLSRGKKEVYLQDMLNKGRLKTAGVKVANNNKLKIVFVPVVEEPLKALSAAEITSLDTEL